MRTMRSCPGCGTASEASAHICANCGRDFGAEQEIADPENLPPGTRLGAYRVLELLGEGGMGRVYVAEHVRLGRRVALKLLRAQFNTNKIAVARFFAEARAVNRISHENIVEITDFFENADGHNYYIMELLKGEDLGHVLVKSGFVPVVRAVDIAMQVASAVTAVHAARIIHRDLKPENVFLLDRPKRPNFVKLLDFGVAKLGDGHGVQMGTTAAGTIIGTPEYMSPEQAGGQEIDARSDIYALGVILYEMVTGTLPFRAKTFGEMVVKHMTVAPKPPSSHNLPYEVPPAVEELILQMLEKDPGRRPQTMAEVEKRLSAIRDELIPLSLDETRQQAQMEAIRRSGASRALKKPEDTAREPTMPATHPAKVDLARELRTPTAPVVPGAKPSEPAKAASELPANVVALLADAAPVEMSAGATMRVRIPARRAVIGIAACGIAALLIVIGYFAAGSRKSEPTAAALSTPTPPPAEPAPPPPPAPPREIKVRFRTTPPGAAVRVAATDRVLGITPFERTFTRAEQPLVFEFELSGYAIGSQEVSLAEDATIAVALSAIVPRAVARPSSQAPAIKRRPKPPPTDRGATMNVFED